MDAQVLGRQKGVVDWAGTQKARSVISPTTATASAFPFFAMVIHCPTAVRLERDHQRVLGAQFASPSSAEPRRKPKHFEVQLWLVEDSLRPARLVTANARL